MKTFTFTRTLPRCLVCAAVSLAGCAATTTPVLDSHFGEALTLLKQQQILYPAAASNTNPVLGLDGRSAISGYKLYQKSFSAPEPLPDVLTIGVSKR
ncbi:MAG: pilus assembly protein [Janthinobacterium svalbardensis]|uniref:Pilus assembly protein n=1 Tax=Janthinobacterium svalbardensis TaxID=368607 RepID=A0A290X142_9BURK|nr:pilus assembly protein [Janthinobacterium svalbardensis]ATD62688.1 pilus assembly protein [Janthinobacterium svalbardensis]